MVELVVAFTIFILLASFISLALARSFSSASSSHTQTRAEAALSDALDKLAAIPYDQLVADDFEVPDACPDSPRGIAGSSCVEAGATPVRISYGYRTDGADESCDGGDAHRPAISYGYLTVNGCMTAIGRTAFSGTGDAGADLPVQTRQINPPRPGFAEGAGTVRVQLTGRYADLPGTQVALIHPAHVVGAGSDAELVPATQVSSGTVDADGVALIAVEGADNTDGDSSGATVCDSANPCALALDVDSTPTIADTGTTTLALSDSTAVGPDASLIVPANAITDVSAHVDAVGSATLALVVDKAGSRTSNPVKGSACVWVTFAASHGKRTVPACNTDTAGRITLDTYDPNWAAYAHVSDIVAALEHSDDRTRYPFPTKTPLRVTVDNPDGTCPYAPGMAASDPTTAAGWAPAAVCTTFTWGAPSHLEITSGEAGGNVRIAPFTNNGAIVTLHAGEAQTGAVVWDNTTLAAPAVGYGPDQAWGKPRTKLGCSADASCVNATASISATVADPDLGYPTAQYPNASCVSDGSCRQPVSRISPEPLECPDEYCYSTNIAAPYLTAPATGTVQLSGETTTFNLDVRDTDDDASTLTAAVDQTPTGTTLTLSGPVRVDEHTRRYQATFIDQSGDSTLKDVTLKLTGGAGDRSRTATVRLGLFHTAGAWAVDGPDVVAHQSDTNVPVRIEVTNTAGAPAAGTDLTFTTDAPGVTIAPATTDDSGYAAAQADISDATPAGTYQIHVVAAGTGRPWDIPLHVDGTTSSLRIDASTTSLRQGGRTTVQLTATDGAAGAVPGIVTRVVVTAPDGLPTSRVHPRSAGCVTTRDGTCTVTLLADRDAEAGAYILGASSGSLTATPVTVEVTPAVTSVTSAQPLQISQGQQLADVRLRVRDGAGAGVPATAVAVTPPAGVTATSATVSTDESGVATFGLTAASDAATGKKTIRVTVDGNGSFDVSVTVSAAYGQITADPTHLGQGDVGNLTVTVSSGSGAPVEDTGISFEVAQPGIVVGPSARTDSKGRATTPVEIGDDVPAGTYPVVVTIGNNSATVEIHVEATPRTAAASGTVLQGGTSTIAVAIYDASGSPIPGQAVTIDGAPDTLSLPAATVTTGADGVAEFTFNDSGTAAAVYSLRLTADDLTTTLAVTVVAAPGQIRAIPSPLTIPTSTGSTDGSTGGSGYAARAEVEVLDRAGLPYPGAGVTIGELPAGVTASVPADTDTQGRTTLTLSADPAVVEPGSYQVTITVGTLTATVPLSIATPSGDSSSSPASAGTGGTP